MDEENLSGRSTNPTTPENTLAENVARAAGELFEARFAEPYRRGIEIPVGPAPGRGSGRALLPLHYLARRGLIELRGPRLYIISDLGRELALDGAGLDAALELSPSWKDQETPPATTTNIFQGPVGAVATATGASAHGTVNVGQVDTALHKAIDLQDQLGEIAETLFTLLRAVRTLERERAGDSEAALLSAVVEAREYEAFQKAVKPQLAPACLNAIEAVLEIVPLLKPALALLK